MLTTYGGFLLILAATALGGTAPAAAAPASAPASPPASIDPVPHAAITEPYRVCQDLEELTGRIDNLYRKPIAKLYREGCAQPEAVYFKDTATGHEIVSLTRELCVDISHPDLKRPVWTRDGSQILFMGNRGFFMADGSLKKGAWPGWKFVMDADYDRQRPLIVNYLDAKGKVARRETSVDGKFNVMDRLDSRYAYYAVKDTLWRVTIGKGEAEATAEAVCTFATPYNKFIQAISDENVLLIQDANAEFVEKARREAYGPEIHLVDLKRKPGEAGFYSHHSFDYGLAEVKDADGKVLHDAKNCRNFHSLMFGGSGPGRGRSIVWNYGSMVDVGEYLDWSLTIANADGTVGLGGVPTHGPIAQGASVNRWGQYQSHGSPLGGGSRWQIYFSGPAKVPDGKGGTKDLGQWGLWLADESGQESSGAPESSPLPGASAASPPTFVLRAPGGHDAIGGCEDPTWWAAFVSRSNWKPPVREQDGIVAGDTDGHWSLICHTYSDARGGIRKDRQTGRVTWSGPDNNDFRPYHAIPRPLLSPDGTKLWFHSSMLQPLEEWCGIYVVTVRKPMPPTGLKLAAARLPVSLGFVPGRMHRETRRYHVYRGDAEGKAFTEINAEVWKFLTPASESFGFVDQEAVAGHTYTYAVTAEEWSTLESDVTSNVVRVTVGKDGVTEQDLPPARGWDTTPPGAVRGFEASAGEEAGQFRLSWQANTEADLRHYNVYFSTAGKPAIEQRRLVASPLARQTRWLDWSAPIGADGFYAITAVDRQGNESAPAHAEVRRP